jgi:hypothetical protein
MTRHDEADHTQDPRGTDTGAGYPEEQPGGAQPGVQRDDHDRHREGAGDDAPSPAGDADGDPGQATGNPNAAG